MSPTGPAARKSATRQLRAASGSLGTAVIARMETDLPWFAELASLPASVEVTLAGEHVAPAVAGEQDVQRLRGGHQDLRWTELVPHDADSVRVTGPRRPAQARCVRPFQHRPYRIRDRVVVAPSMPNTTVVPRTWRAAVFAS